MKIPISFNLAVHTIKVIYEDTVLKEKSELGEARLIESEIWLNSDLMEDDTIPYETKLLVFYHEKVHHILHIMGEHELVNNEKFVDLFANLLLQTDLTAKYDECTSSSS